MTTLLWMILFHILLFIIIFVVSFSILYKKRHSGPKYPLMQRCGKHIFYQYKSVCGHISLDSYDEVNFKQIAKIIMNNFENGRTTEQLGEIVFDKK